MNDEIKPPMPYAVLWREYLKMQRRVEHYERLVAFMNVIHIEGYDKLTPVEFKDVVDKFFGICDEYIDEEPELFEMLNEGDDQAQDNERYEDDLAAVRQSRFAATHGDIDKMNQLSEEDIERGGSPRVTDGENAAMLWNPEYWHSAYDEAMADDPNKGDERLAFEHLLVDIESSLDLDLSHAQELGDDPNPQPALNEDARNWCESYIARFIKAWREMKAADLPESKYRTAAELEAHFNALPEWPYPKNGAELAQHLTLCGLVPSIEERDGKRLKVWTYPALA